jgi:uncharacterized repeat protein (TIGR03803 family)
MREPGVTRSMFAGIVMLGSLAASPIARAAPVLTTLANFNTVNGWKPYGGVIVDDGGNLYGAAERGGTFGIGTLFKIPSGSSQPVVLAHFDGANGAFPTSSLTVGPSGNLYGTTMNGGDFGYGTVFEFDITTNTLSRIATFNGTNGAAPKAALTFDHAGNLYGTTVEGGVNSNFGTVFKIAAGTNALSTVATFKHHNGAYPHSTLTIDTGGNLYGTTSQGGANGVGTVFKIANGSSAITTLASFDTSNGSTPTGAFHVRDDGMFVGTTHWGGSNHLGTVFVIDPQTAAFQTLAHFQGSNGANPYPGLIADRAGNLFGTTVAGGAFSDGTVYRIDRGTGAITTLVSFASLTNGRNPYAGLAADAAGNLYGATYEGGPIGFGTVFKIEGAGFVVPEPVGPAGLVGLIGLVAGRRRS